MSKRKQQARPLRVTAVTHTHRTVDSFASWWGADNQPSASQYTLTYQSRDRIRLEAACRGSRIVRAAVDAIPEDMTHKCIEMSGLDPIGVLADVLGSIDDRAGELAKIADERGVAGQ
ncbi:DUF1073 domain-containing protein [Burkholderia sp. Ac-20345]|nr:DUF1073 domain-containing protein [Burkholderia sp. Ac-20345]